MGGSGVSDGGIGVFVGGTSMMIPVLVGSGVLVSVGTLVSVAVGSGVDVSVAVGTGVSEGIEVGVAVGTIQLFVVWHLEHCPLLG